MEYRKQELGDNEFLSWRQFSSFKCPKALHFCSILATNLFSLPISYKIKWELPRWFPEPRYLLQVTCSASSLTYLQCKIFGFNETISLYIFIYASWPTMDICRLKIHIFCLLEDSPWFYCEIMKVLLKINENGAQWYFDMQNILKSVLDFHFPWTLWIPHTHMAFEFLHIEINLSFKPCFYKLFGVPMCCLPVFVHVWILALLWFLTPASNPPTLYLAPLCFIVKCGFLFLSSRCWSLPKYLILGLRLASSDLVS